MPPTSRHPDRPDTYVPVTIADGIRASARRAPGKIALEEASRAVTYAELVDRIARVANGVAHDARVRPGDHAAIFAPNCLEFVELVAGLADAGVPPALINARSASSELAFNCDDAEARVLFVHPSLEEVARAAKLDTVEEIVVIGPEYERWLARQSAAWAGPHVEEWDPFCIHYTSGTTGRPKGVMLSHRSRTLTFLSMAVEFGCYGPAHRTLAVAPLFHGAGFAFAVAELFLGGSCVVLPRFDPEHVLASIADKRITNLFMVPTHFKAMFELGEATMGRYDTSSIATIISTAAPLSQVMKERIIGFFGDGVLFESYGSTEGGIVANLGPADQLRKRQCVGLPMPCTTVRILDEAGAEVAPGAIGELHSRSPYLFNGYWKRPEETATVMQDGWCSAGDLARQDDEGYLYIVDRKDDKIISGGVNIYPREIEEVLARHPEVTDAAVIGVPSEYWGEAVHAVVVPRMRGLLTAEALDAFCRASLSAYKVPKSYDFATSLPKNASGKILRRELRQPFWRSASPRSASSIHLE